MCEYECKKCSLKSYSAAHPETLLFKNCLDKSCDGKIELSKLVEGNEIWQRGD